MASAGKNGADCGIPGCVSGRMKAGEIFPIHRFAAVSVAAFPALKRPVRRAISKMAMCIQRKGGCGHPAALRQPGEGVRTAGGTEEKKLVFALASIANHRRQISGKPLFNGSGFAPVSDMAPRNQPSRNPEIRAGAWPLDTVLWFSQAKPAYGKLIWPRKVSERGQDAGRARRRRSGTGGAIARQGAILLLYP